ncbi:MAG: PAS domain S-box protein [Bdellovibrionales bacterium]|nr:PAS domain S-box protein [Bdellovibrionales bacterium]
MSKRVGRGLLHRWLFFFTCGVIAAGMNEFFWSSPTIRLVSIGVGLFSLTLWLADSLLAHRLEAFLALQPSTPTSQVLFLLFPRAEKATRELSARLSSQQEKLDTVIRRYELLTEHVAAVITIHDAQGTLTYCSPYAEVLTGFALDDIYAKGGHFFENISHPEDRDYFVRARRLNEIGEAFQYRFRFRHKAGMEMWAESRSVPLFSSTGEFSSSLTVTLDVTRTVRYQQQVEDTNRDLEDFTFLVSNNMKEPLFTIQGMNSLLREELGEKVTFSSPEHPCSYIATAAAQLELLVNQVLEYAQLSATDPKLSRLSLASIFDEVLSDFQPKLLAEEVSVSLPSSPPAVLGERRQLHAVFGNILETYLRAHSKGSPMTVEISSSESADPRFVQIDISAEAERIRPEDLASTFRPFRGRDSGSRSRSAALNGPTLTSTKKLIEKLGGTLSASLEGDTRTKLSVQLRKAP